MAKNKNGEAEVTDSVMKDKVVKAAIKHSGTKMSPSRAAEEKAEQTETSLRTEGQRRINFVWEFTQSAVAISVTIATLYVAGRLALRDQADVGAFLLLSNVFFLVLGTYFSRTNHVRVGGVGKDQEGR